mmetsp:Transcript_37358/g.68879  ORF Transcript_37358/g.68879 Transcript_37358/m.68879 type:complete len:80 (-) Transcript_37358:68-307(-)
MSEAQIVDRLLQPRKRQREESTTRSPVFDPSKVFDVDVEPGVDIEDGDGGKEDDDEDEVPASISQAAAGSSKRRRLDTR